MHNPGNKNNFDSSTRNICVRQPSNADYLLDETSNSELFTKEIEQSLDYMQELAARYLRPPTPPPVDRVIQQEMNLFGPPSPPLIIRQQSPRPIRPYPLVIRESPPKPNLGRKIITVSSKRMPPVPKKVLGQLATLPTKSRSVITGKGMPYTRTKPKVVYRDNFLPDLVVAERKNTNIQWDASKVELRKEFKYLGMLNANPIEYVNTYGTALKSSTDLPAYVHEIKLPHAFAADYCSKYELEGDIHVADLRKRSLDEYAKSSILLNRLETDTVKVVMATASVYAAVSDFLEGTLEKMFKILDTSSQGVIDVEEALRIFVRINSRLGKRHDINEVEHIFKTLDINSDFKLNLDEFKKAFVNIGF